ncbi:hypothetical protein [Actibacterium sp. 188UL27-1]|uniref:hypothetical protein n=1 Tax=Actibacterium sp. 188UL27-1 TaxID=2786961 RepID=UPI00195B785B|nr:hypothetical protein [Actibacterium sp. 188UL27-1]MBM7068803.1 hypothetical protein [Actibacterium sp. 188UL27-1]
MTGAILWDYPKSSASYRVRIALNMTGEPYETAMVDLSDGANRTALNRAVFSGGSNS